MSTISSGTTLTTALVQTGDTTGDLVIKTGSSNTTAMTISGSDQSVVLAAPLAVASGGTGQSNLSSITVGNVSGIVAIANGGTNANTAAQALSNLGGTSAAKSYAINMVLL